MRRGYIETQTEISHTTCLSLSFTFLSLEGNPSMDGPIVVCCVLTPLMVGLVAYTIKTQCKHTIAFHTFLFVTVYYYLIFTVDRLSSSLQYTVHALHLIQLPHACTHM